MIKAGEVWKCWGDGHLIRIVTDYDQNSIQIHVFGVGADYTTSGVIMENYVRVNNMSGGSGWRNSEWRVGWLA